MFVYLFSYLFDTYYISGSSRFTLLLPAVVLTRFLLRVPNLLGNRLFICTFRQIAGLSHAELSNCGKVVLLIVGPLICSEDK